MAFAALYYGFVQGCVCSVSHRVLHGLEGGITICTGFIEGFIESYEEKRVDGPFDR